jgi:6,7-dimethyl-8-ribityllumazine synthase
MAANLKNCSSNLQDIPSAEKMKFGIVISEWNQNITGLLYQGAKETLIKHGAKEENINVIKVPGSFELTAGAKLLAQQTDVDAVICIGCVIKGETPHFDYICQGVSQGITNLNIKYEIPFIFCVLTTHNQLQALARAGGVYGNKGSESAITAIKMIELFCRLKK